MPYKSRAEQGWFHAHAGKEISKAEVNKWDQETEAAGGFSKLPAKKQSFDSHFHKLRRGK